jgi:hypothetical protein
MYRVVASLPVALTAIALAAATPAAGPAQVTRGAWPSVDSLRPGDTVRVWSSVPRIVGAVALVSRLERDTLTLQDVPGRRILPRGVAVPVPALIRLDVQRGYRRSALLGLTGVVLGLAGGAVVGGFAGVALECGTSCADEGEWGGFAGAVLGGGLGALAGAITGGVIGARRRPRWEPVGLPAR